MEKWLKMGGLGRITQKKSTLPAIFFEFLGKMVNLHLQFSPVAHFLSVVAIKPLNEAWPKHKKPKDWSSAVLG